MESTIASDESRTPTRLAAALVGVSKGFRDGTTPDAPRREVLRDMSVQVSPGSIVVIRGPSGSGKTTLLNLLAGIETPDNGAVYLAGKPLSELDDDGRTLLRRRCVGFVFQSFNLIPTLSVVDNVAMPLSLLGTAMPAARAQAREVLGSLNLADRASANVEVLSGGEQQRIAVARALIHRPDIVLADEPTGNLDRRTGRVVLELLAKRVRGEGAALVMVTHSDEAAALADETILLDGDA